MTWGRREQLAVATLSAGVRRDRWALRALFLALGALLWNLQGPFWFTWWLAGVVAGLVGTLGAAWLVVIVPILLLTPTYADTQAELYMVGYPALAMFGLLNEVLAGFVGTIRGPYLGRDPSIGTWSARTRLAVLGLAVACAVGALLLGVPFGQGECDTPRC